MVLIKFDVMNKTLPIFIFLMLHVGTTVYAQDNYTAPHTEWGQPDLQGAWNFSTNIPMQRPAMFGDKDFLTEEEIETRTNQTELGLQALNNVGSGGYNIFWLEMGSGRDNRTSLITYPENDRLPDLVEGSSTLNGGLGPGCCREGSVRLVVGGIAKDGPKDRCVVGLNARPPFFPSLYNNNIQMV